jgi:hypothetical protein
MYESRLPSEGEGRGKLSISTGSFVFRLTRRISTLSEATLACEVEVARGPFLGSRERVPVCLGDADLIVYGLLFGVVALCA